jgi:hypothetical protein
MASAVQTPVKELVLINMPKAFEDSDGEWTHIRRRVALTEPCPHCRQDWTHDVIDTGIFGGGVTSEEAWESAAKNLGLLCYNCKNTGLLSEDRSHGYCNCPKGRQLASTSGGDYGL